MLERYGVDYIYVSDYERSEFDVDTQALDALYETVFENQDVTIYRVGGAAQEGAEKAADPDEGSGG